MNLYLRGAIKHLSHNKISAGLNILNLVNVMLATLLALILIQRGGVPERSWFDLSLMAIFAVGAFGIIYNFTLVNLELYGDREKEISIRKMQGATNVQLFVSFLAERLIQAGLAFILFIGIVDIASGLVSRYRTISFPLMEYLAGVTLIWMIACLLISGVAVYLIDKHDLASGRMPDRARPLASFNPYLLLIEMICINLLGVIAVFSSQRSSDDLGSIVLLFVLMLSITYASLVTLLLYKFKWNSKSISVKRLAGADSNEIVLKPVGQFILTGSLSALPAVFCLAYFYENIASVKSALVILAGLAAIQLTFILIVFWLARLLISNNRDKSELFKIRCAL